MLVYMSQYVEERAASPSPSSVKVSTRAAASKAKKGKINFVSKASLATFDPRHAMGIDTGHDWYESASNTPDSRSSFDQSFKRSARHSEDNERAHKWTTSPTPELEAFTGSMEDYAYRPSNAVGASEMTRQSSASSSVFEDDRDVPESASRRRFYSRKSVAPSMTAVTNPADGILFSPLGAKPKSLRSAGAGSATGTASASNSSFTRFFARRKKNKAAHLSGIASRSTPDLFDGMPQSAPPTTLTFEQSGFQFSPQRKASDASSLYGSPSSLPNSPERQRVSLARENSPSRTSPLSKKKSTPALRQIREAHNAVGASQARSITFASLDERPRARQSMASHRSESFDVAPALPPLPSFDTSSPMIPAEFIFDSKRRTVRESQMPQLGSKTRPVSRAVSSTKRGVPSPSLNPIRINDLRTSTITLRNVPVLHSAHDAEAPTKSTTGESAAVSQRRGANPRSAAAAEKRMSMTQRVVDGLLDQNHGREEPEMRARRSDMEVRSARRRSRSADGRSAPIQRLHDYASPPSSNSHADSVFPAFVRHAPVSPSRANSPQPRFFSEIEKVSAITPIPKQPPHFAAPVSASSASSRPSAPKKEQTQSPASRSPQRQNSGETHQARRVNFATQRAKAVAVASPLLLSKSPRLGGRSGTPLPVVNIMPPTPDLGAGEEVQERQEAIVQHYERAVAQQKNVPARTKAAAEATKVAVPAERPSCPVRVHDATRAVKPAVAATKEAVAASAPRAPEQAVAVMPRSPESVYSPASVYSPEETADSFTSLHAGLFGSDDTVLKDEMEITADSVAVELSYVGMPRTDSVTSELSEASSARSSSSGAFAFSRSMSSSSLVSGGTFSSASSNASESPERKINQLASSSSFDFSPTKMASSASLASTAGTSIFELDAGQPDDLASKGDAPADAVGALGPGKLETPFQLKGPSSAGLGAAQTAAGDSSDCDTPTLASCRQMSATAVQRVREKSAANRPLGLSMDLSDLAQELGLGRLSQIGLAHLKGVDALAEKPTSAATAPQALTLGTVNAAVPKRTSPIKPPKSSARATTASSAVIGGGPGMGLSRFGAGVNDIASSAAMSPLPVSIAGRSPQTPPRTKVALVEPQPGRKVSASGVPKTEGGFGLGLDFAQSPSPQAQSRKAAITSRSYHQRAVDVDIPRTDPIQYNQHEHQHHAYEQEDEAEWVGVAM